jgi:hypothetical protein
MFRFTIRDVLWLTVVVALGIGWWIDHRRMAAVIDFQDFAIRTQSELDEIARDLEKIPPPPGPRPATLNRQ